MGCPHDTRRAPARQIPPRDRPRRGSAVAACRPGLPAHPAPPAADRRSARGVPHYSIWTMTPAPLTGVL